MSKPTQKHLFLVEVETEEEIKDLKNVITGRLHSKQGLVGMPRGWPVRIIGTPPNESMDYNVAGPVLELHLGEVPKTEFPFVHRKSGGRYAMVGLAKVQTASPLTDMANVTVYQSEDGKLWVRPDSEFVSRFEQSN